jgi:hypothetical protein
MGHREHRDVGGLAGLERGCAAGRGFFSVFSVVKVL